MGGGSEAILLVNTKARRGQDWFAQAKALLSQGDIRLLEALEFDAPAALTAKAKEATERGIPLVIVGGGDGTLRSVVRHLVGSRSVLGVLPMGTGNQFACELGIPSNVEAACRVLEEGKVAAVDLGVAGDDYFLTVATVGLTTHIVQHLTRDEKRRLGRLAYVVALAQVLRKLEPMRATLTMPEGVQSFETMEVVIGNGRFHAGVFPLAPNASITDGKLTVYVVATTSRWGLFRYALNLPGGHQVDLKEVSTFITSEMVLETTPAERVTVDGELPFCTPLRFGIAPKALRVMVPQGFDGADLPPAS